MRVKSTKRTGDRPIDDDDTVFGIALFEPNVARILGQDILKAAYKTHVPLSYLQCIKRRKKDNTYLKN